MMEKVGESHHEQLVFSQLLKRSCIDNIPFFTNFHKEKMLINTVDTRNISLRKKIV